MKLLALLVVLVIALSSVAIAKSYCPANSLYRCNCPNGRYETYTTVKAVQEARKDPESCCYVNPKPKREPTVVNSIVIPELVESGELMASPPPAQEIVDPPVIQEAIVINDAIIIEAAPVIEDPPPPEDPITQDIQEEPTWEEYWNLLSLLISCLTFYCR